MTSLRHGVGTVVGALRLLIQDVVFDTDAVDELALEMFYVFMGIDELVAKDLAAMHVRMQGGRLHVAESFRFTSNFYDRPSGNIMAVFRFVSACFARP